MVRTIAIFTMLLSALIILAMAVIKKDIPLFFTGIACIIFTILVSLSENSNDH